MIRGIPWWQLGLTVLGIYMFVAGLRGTEEWMRARQRLTDASSNLEQIRHENEELQARWKSVSDPMHAEQLARDELRMQLPGETVIVIKQEGEQQEEIGKKDKSDESVQNWEKWAKLLRL